MVLKAMQTGADSFVVQPFAAKTIKEKLVQVLSKQAQNPSFPV